MKKAIRVFSVILAILMLVLTFAGCNNSHKDPTPGENENNNQSSWNGDAVAINETTYAGGTHIYNVGSTNDYLIKDGTSEYTIVIPASSDASFRNAAMEMVECFAEATGVMLPLVTDEAFASSPTAKFISLGDTTLLRAQNISSIELGYSGIRIVTIDKCIYAFGKTVDASYYALYELLHQTINWEFFSNDCIAYDKDVKQIPLMNYDITDLPDFEYRERIQYYTNKHKGYQRTESMVLGTLAGGQWHNTFLVYPQKTYQAQHGKWYEATGQQLCYTAHGDEAEFEAMVNVLVEQLKVETEKQPRATHFAFTHEDNSAWCSCDACKKVIEDNGNVKVATIIKFIKEVASRFDSWLKQEHPDRDITILIFAYTATIPSPTKLVNGEYVPVNDDMILPSNVGIVYAPIEADFPKGFTDAYNTNVYEAMRGWSALTENMWYWIYDFNIADYFVPWDSYGAIKENYITLLENNAQWVFDQSYDDPAISHFTVLSSYVNYKLQWNVNQDVNELIDRFMDNYFLDAASAMSQYFNEMRAHFDYLTKEFGYLGRIAQAVDSSMYSYPLLMHWQDLINQAYQSIEQYKTTSPATYEALARRINLESISIRYMIIAYHSMYYSYSELQQMKLQFKNDCGELGITRCKEGKPTSLLWESWGI